MRQTDKAKARDLVSTLGVDPLDAGRRLDQGGGQKAGVGSEWSSPHAETMADEQTVRDK